MQVAGRYQKDQRSVAFGHQLIGPVLFPLYIKILSLNLAITLVVCAGAAVAFSSHQPMLQTAMAMLSHFIFQFAIITGIFALAQRSGDRFPWGWKSPHPTSRSTAQEGRRIPRSQSIAELIVILLPWLPTLPFYPRTIFGDGTALLGFGPGAQILFKAIYPLILLGVIRSCILLANPRRVRFYWVMRWRRRAPPWSSWASPSGWASGSCWRIRAAAIRPQACSGGGKAQSWGRHRPDLPDRRLRRGLGHGAPAAVGSPSACR